MTPHIDIMDETGRMAEQARNWLHDRVREAMVRLGAAGDLRVRIVGDEAMARAHEEFAGVEGTTDVLTFDMSDPELQRPQIPSLDEVKSGNVRNAYVIDTDILVCIDEALRQATPQGYPFERELLLYVVHGVLHCLGFDDHEEEDYAAMHAMEDVVLAAIGVGPVFHRPRERPEGHDGAT
ncbi:MAG: rRNA maturation RNase YbeY [Planctomycetes bacterium]|nr:rRNA maturation RNase YbeY [Planctomycetota bacterium]